MLGIKQHDANGIDGSKNSITLQANMTTISDKDYLPRFRHENPKSGPDSQFLQHLPHDPDNISLSFCRVQQPAFVAPNCLLSHTGTDEIVGPRTRRPMLPSQDLRMFQHIRSTSPVGMNGPEFRLRNNTPKSFRRLRSLSPTSSYNHSIDTSSFPAALARSSRNRTAWQKARAQYARDWVLCQSSETEKMDASSNTERMNRSPEPEHRGSFPCRFAPKRKQSTFVKEEEMKFLFEDQVGTPHISELQLEDDIDAQLILEELDMGGKVEAEGLLFGSLEGLRRG